MQLRQPLEKNLRISRGGGWESRVSSCGGVRVLIAVEGGAGRVFIIVEVACEIGFEAVFVVRLVLVGAQMAGGLLMVTAGTAGGVKAGLEDLEGAIFVRDVVRMELFEWKGDGDRGEILIYSFRMSLPPVHRRQTAVKFIM